MTPAESGLEMAKLTRPDTDTSLLNTNMSAAWAAKSTHRDKRIHISAFKMQRHNHILYIYNVLTKHTLHAEMVLEVNGTTGFIYSV